MAAPRQDHCGDVVLVTFRDAHSSDTDLLHSTYYYHDYDRPWGEVGQGVNRRLTADSYRRRDFLRMLAGGYAEGGHPEPFVTPEHGPNITVANNHQLPEVFGSVRAYFDSVSNGRFHLHVRMVNPPAAGQDEDGLPRWIELPETKEYYAELIDNLRNQNVFWNDAYDATLDSLRLVDPAWENVRMRISLPHHDSTATYPFTRLLRRKILFLYSGVVFAPDLDTTRAGVQHGLLHPQVDEITDANPAQADEVGYRYVMGERQGFGRNGHGIDEFAGIGTHAHEIGHLLGLTHGEGYWEDSPNRYSGAPQYTNAQGANQLGWTLMQGGGDQGPEDDDGRYWLAYRSCPNPINPFYLMDLGWLTPDEIRGPHDDYAIAPGTTHWIERNTTQGPVEFLLNRRTLQSFDGRYVSFYDYATGNDAEQGLMIWRRYSEHHPHWEERPMLIVADERRYRNARDRDWNPDVHEYHDMLSDPFAAGEIADRRYNHTGSTQADVSEVTSLNAGEGLRQETLGELRRGTRDGRGYHPDPVDLNLALTDIRYDGDDILVDVTFAPQRLRP
ncbi:MAG: hypothetical protein J4F35_15570 [Candidatus Latescibacteria bacterium]|nr:hypothetical protein [Candidatus Latescibacterota bacterium]